MREALERVVDGGVGGLGARVVRFYIRALGERTDAPSLEIIIRGAMCGQRAT